MAALLLQKLLKERGFHGPYAQETRRTPVTSSRFAWIPACASNLVLTQTLPRPAENHLAVYEKMTQRTSTGRMRDGPHGWSPLLSGLLFMLFLLLKCELPFYHSLYIKTVKNLHPGVPPLPFLFFSVYWEHGFCSPWTAAVSVDHLPPHPTFIIILCYFMDFLPYNCTGCGLKDLYCMHILPCSPSTLIQYLRDDYCFSFAPFTCIKSLVK